MLDLIVYHGIPEAPLEYVSNRNINAGIIRLVIYRSLCLVRKENDGAERDVEIYFYMRVMTAGL